MSNTIARNLSRLPGRQRFGSPLDSSTVRQNIGIYSSAPVVITAELFGTIARQILISTGPGSHSALHLLTQSSFLNPGKRELLSIRTRPHGVGATINGAPPSPAREKKVRVGLNDRELPH